MTSIRLTTNLPSLYPELTEVIRLFLGDVPISEAEGETHILHEHKEENGFWTETVSTPGHEPFSKTVSVWELGIPKNAVLTRIMFSTDEEFTTESACIQVKHGKIHAVMPKNSAMVLKYVK